MNAQQIKWASQHDWFVRADFLGGFVWEVVVRHDLIEGVTLVFSSYAELREWAGY